jgi:ribonuclease D
VSHRFVQSDAQLEQYCHKLARCPSIAFDTEFVAERTYRPVLCLVQVACDGQLALIDSLSVEDMAPFWRVVAEPGHETIVHAGRGEFEFCLRAIGRRPAGWFDVQLAAGLTGIEYPAGFRTLVSKLLGKALKAQETRTDWRRRPLTRRQVEYALDDVRFLHAIRDELYRRLETLGRRAWLDEEMATWQDEAEEAISREQWRRVSGSAALDRRGLAVVRELWRWRESVARRRDCPARRVLRDDLIVELAKRKTSEIPRIRAVRGLERGDLKRCLPDLAKRIEQALALPEDQWPTKPFRREKEPQLPVLGQFLYSALGSLCRQMDLAPALVGTPSDVREWIMYRAGRATGDRPPRLARGWRAEVVGQLFDDLLSGRKSIRIQDADSEHPLAFDETD